MIEIGGKVKTIIQKCLKFVDLRNIVKNDIYIEKSVLMTDDFKGSLLHFKVNHSFKNMLTELLTQTQLRFFGQL